MADVSKDPAIPENSVRCACGAQVSVAADSMGRDLTCPSCGATFKVMWALDSKTREKVLMRVPAKGKDIRIPPGSHKLVCTCGQPLVARNDMAGKKVKCPVCGVSMVIEQFRDPQTLETKIRRVGEESKSKGTSVIAAHSLGRTTRRRKAPIGAQDILCGCGEYLRVFAEHLEKKVMCPSCGTLMKMERSKDPQTSITQVRPRIIGKGVPPPRPDPDAWSMEDFT